jgi:4-diphosphocytidyl-2-C-methyl-D-erythritol kinase
VTPQRVHLRCPAKVNLALRILGRREDGYHELDTVFQAIELWDELVAEVSDELTLSCDDPSLPIDETNLVLRAARLLRRELPAHGGARGARLQLSKRIPAGAGLGGGSSDAAASLLALTKLWGLRPAPGQLEALACELGSDVPFFLHGGTARGTGRGDQIEPLPFVGELPILLGLPPYPLATADVYRAHAQRLTHPEKDVTMRRFSYRLKWPGDNDLSLPVCNDLEGVVFTSRPELAGFRDALEAAGARFALLSGSGSTVFGVFDDSSAVQRAVALVAPRFSGWKLRATRAFAHGPEGGD